jgi:hypothetical protein
MMHSLMMLALEANHVVGLRLIKLMRGGERSTARKPANDQRKNRCSVQSSIGRQGCSGISGVEWLQMRRDRARAGLGLGESGANANSVD